MPQRLDPTLLHAITPPVFDKGKLHRGGLVDRIHANLEKSLVVIAAPPGYGKTTLLADFTAHTDIAVCWVRLGSESADVGELARLTAQSVCARFPRAKMSRLARIAVSSTPESLAREISGWLETELSEPFVLVIDDAQHLNRSEGGLKFLDELLRQRPVGFTVILLGREVPDLSLARLLAEEQLFGLGPNDMALTREEVEKTVQLATNYRSSAESIDRLFEETKGWITGVVLSGLVTHGSLGAVTAHGSPLVHDYLSSVVLNHLPDDLRRFSLDASVLPFMTPELCTQLLERPESSSALRQLLKKGIFVEVSGSDQPTYRFHDIFRTFLLTTMQNSGRARLARLRGRAAMLLEKGGAAELAFQLYVEGGEYAKAAIVAERNARRTILSGRMRPLEFWWDTLAPRDFALPNLLLCLAVGYADKGDVPSAERILATAKRHIQTHSPHSLTAGLENVRGWVHFQKGEYSETIACAGRVLRKDARQVTKPLYSVALQRKALSLATTRRKLHIAHQCAEDAIALLHDSRDQQALARAWTVLGFVLEAEGQYRSLGQVAERIVGLLRDSGTSDEMAFALNNAATARHREGDLDGSLAAYDEALKHARLAANPLAEAAVLMGQADVFNDAGMALQAAHLYGEGMTVAARVDNQRLLQYCCLQTSILYRRRKNVEVAKEWVKRAIDLERDPRRAPGLSVQMAALEALASPRNGSASLRKVIRDRKSELSNEELAISTVILASCLKDLGDLGGCRDAVETALTVTGTGGIEQAVAAELASNSQLRRVFEEIASGNPVMDVIIGRIESMEAFRRSHSSIVEAATGTASVEIVALGRPRILKDRRAVVGLKRQAREVLYYLVDRGSADRDLLAEVFWPQHPPGRRSANTHTAIHSIRRVLGKEAVILENGVYTIDSELSAAYDVRKFERAAEVAARLSSGDPRKFFALTEAVNSYAGTFLIDVASPWAMERRREIELRYLDLVAELANEALVKGQPIRALEHLRRAIAIDPLRDDFNLQYLETLGRMGQRSEISTHYKKYTQLLRDELGIDPPATIRELYTRLIG